MTTDVLINGEVTLPKAILDAAGIHPGGGIIVQREAPAMDPAFDEEAHLAELHAIARDGPLRGDDD